MNKTLAISIIAVVAVAMVMSAAAPALAVQTDAVDPGPGPRKKVVPLAVVDPQGACAPQKKGNVCVAVDHNSDGICDSKPVSIPGDVAKRIGITGICKVLKK